MANSKHNSTARKSYQLPTAYLRICCLVLAGLLTASTISCAQAPGNQSDVEWLIEVLQLDKGSVVADIGAGDGDQTLAIADYIGPEGKIYSTELGSSSMRELREAVKDAGATNVEVIEGDPNSTNLPEECCNALYLRRVYHHIDNPGTFNSSLFKTLKPGGRLAIIDFEPRSSEADPEERDQGSQHGVTAETVVKELTKAGFELVSSERGSGRDIYVVMTKPKLNN